MSIFTIDGHDHRDAKQFRHLLETSDDQQKWQVRRDVSNPLYAGILAHDVYPLLKEAIVADMAEIACTAHAERGFADLDDLQRAGYSLSISERYGPNPHAYSGPSRFSEAG